MLCRKSSTKRFYFPTSSNKYFCTIRWYRKPINCIFSLKWCSLLCQQTHKTLKTEIITESQPHHPSFTKWLTACTRQDLGKGFSILPPVTTCFTFTKSVTVTKMWIILHQAQHESRWTVLLGYLEQMIAAIKHIAHNNFVFMQGSTPQIVCTTPSNCCSNFLFP